MPQLRQQQPGGQPVVEEAAVLTHQLCVLICRPSHQLLRRMLVSYFGCGLTHHEALSEEQGVADCRGGQPDPLLLHGEPVCSARRRAPLYRCWRQVAFLWKASTGQGTAVVCTFADMIRKYKSVGETFID